jgi:SET domain-containing protein
LTKKDFKKDDHIYSIKPAKVNQDAIIIYKHNNKYNLLDLITHTVNQQDHRLFYYFDTFINHSCDPNTYSTYDNNVYTVYAKNDIKANDELTLDYTDIDTFNDNKKFKCNCNSSNCKVWI